MDRRPSLSFDSALPLPGEDAQAHSACLVARIRAEIEAAGGWIPFARYMELALYAPALGYYVAGSTKFGAAGDFVTAPDMTPLFGASLATQVAAILEATSGREIVELGAGTGRLAADLLTWLEARSALPSRYMILETSPDLRERQSETLQRESVDHLSRVVWVDALPSQISGAVIANEVLDAIPVHLVAHRAGEWLERGVVIADEKPSGSGQHASFAWQERPAEEALAALAASRYPEHQSYWSELNPAAEALVETIGESLTEGACLYLDYGFPAAEYYHPQRDAGTLMCHYRHRAHGDPFVYPGLTDITAHVDFSAMAAAGFRASLSVAGFTTQAAFLLGCGILDRLADVDTPGTIPYVKAAAAVQRLLSPSEMGELCKVLALARSSNIDWPGFSLFDHSDRL